MKLIEAIGDIVGVVGIVIFLLIVACIGVLIAYAPLWAILGFMYWLVVR